MKFGSLFTGIGGIDLGLERAGMDCAWQVEIDDYATKVLERHWPDVQKWRDVDDFIADTCNSGSWPERVSVICGGFPCQPVSMAGRRNGMVDERWLWGAFRDVIKLFKPTWVLAENVPGLLSANAGRAFGTVLRDLAKLGYDAEWQVLPAAAFGAPHLRKRVFIVAYRSGNGRNERRAEPARQQRRLDSSKRGANVIDNHEPRLSQRQGQRSYARQEQPALIGTDWRTIKPTIRRGDHGVPYRVDRLKVLGNAVVPQVAEWVGRQIIMAG